MKRSLLLLAFSLFISAAFAEGYKIKITSDSAASVPAKIKGWQNMIAYMLDSVATDGRGSITFEADTFLPGGLYVLTVGNRGAEFFISDKKNQNFSIHLTKDGAIYTNSPENEANRKYQKQVQIFSKKADSLRALAEKASPMQIAILENEFKKLQQESTNFAKDIIEKNKGTLLATFLKIYAFQPNPPMTLSQEAVQEYMRQHFFDSFDFNDPRILNTEVPNRKLDEYMYYFLHNQPDSVKEKYITLLFQKASVNKRVYNEIVLYVFRRYEGLDTPLRSEEMLRFVGQNYMLKGVVTNDAQRFRVEESIKRVSLNMIGEKVADLQLTKIDTTPMSLYDALKGEINLLMFFNPGCHACQETMNLISPMLKEYPKVNVVAIYPDEDFELLKSYSDNMPKGWIVLEDYHRTGEVRRKYDLFAIPLMYLVDKNKVLIMKDVNAEKLEDYLRKNGR